MGKMNCALSIMALGILTIWNSYLCCAQFYDSDVNYAFDEFSQTEDFKRYFKNKSLTEKDTYNIYNEIIDSLAFVIIDEYVRDSLFPKNKMHWPIRIAASDLTYPQTSDQQYYAMNQYGLLSPFYMSCLEDHSIRMFDSVLYNYIKIKNGDDFFSRVIHESDSITKKGMGLTIPYIIGDSSNTIAKIKSAVAFLDTVDKFNSKYKTKLEYLLLTFKDDQLTNAEIAVPVLDGPIMPYYDNTYNGKILSNLARYKWQGVRYLDQPVSKQVVVELNSNKIYVNVW